MGLDRKTVLILLAMEFAVLVDGLDSSIVNVMLPVIGSDFHVDTSTVAWLIITYMMMLTGLLLPFGRIADNGKIRKVFVIGFAVFSIASAGCGLSTSIEMLIVWRLIQGVGAAMLGSTAGMICVKFIPPSHLSLALSLLVVGSAAGYGLGPAMGGILTDCLSWHWAFFINVPIGVVAIVFGLFVIPKEKSDSKIRIDLPGTILMFIGVVCIVYFLEMFINPETFTSAVVALVAGIVAFIVFVPVEKRHKEPLLNPGMFRDLKFDSLLASYLLINLIYMGCLYLMPFYMEMPLGLSATATGLILVIASAVNVIIGIPIGRYCDMHGRRGCAVLAGFLCIVFSVMLLVAAPEYGWAYFIPIQIVGGFIWGLCGASSNGRIIDHLDNKDKGIGSALSTFVAYGGAAMGTAIFASLISVGAGSVGIPIDELSNELFIQGFAFAMVFSVILSVICMFTAWAVKDDKRSV